MALEFISESQHNSVQVEVAKSLTADMIRNPQRMDGNNYAHSLKLRLSLDPRQENRKHVYVES